jgi:hypothetical protein
MASPRTTAIFVQNVTRSQAVYDARGRLLHSESRSAQRRGRESEQDMPDGGRRVFRDVSDWFTARGLPANELDGILRLHDANTQPQRRRIQTAQRRRQRARHSSDSEDSSSESSSSSDSSSDSEDYDTSDSDSDDAGCARSKRGSCSRKRGACNEGRMVVYRRR